ncbi:hypothetical protein [Nocardia flavorosea]|uniref:hypothetical protein n=1 Tax=Nocardia flavorosea TaxID=53429 RepID=UPI002456B608|nr:hypothetical protein [Nocardia flavorosea]
MTNDSNPPGDTVPGHVRDAVREAGWPGVTLPRTKVSDYTVYPVVTIDPRAWADRTTAGQPPELDRSTLAFWEAWTEDLGASPPRPAVSIVGFGSTTPRPAAALETLDALAGYGAGLWVAHADPDRVDILVYGRRGPVHTAQRGVALRHKEELLFDHALSGGYAPTGQVVA